MTPTEHGALVGSGIGAATGAVIGHQSGHADSGALIGAAAGALGGAVIGHDQQMRGERDAAIAAARYAEWERQAAAQAVTNQDIIRMTKGGLSDSVIVNAIQTRGGRFDMSTDAMIALKAEGVGDQVIQTMQQGASGATTTAVPPRTTAVVQTPVPPPPAVVYVAPHPAAHIVIGPKRCRPHRRHHRHWHRHW